MMSNSMRKLPPSLANLQVWTCGGSISGNDGLSVGESVGLVVGLFVTPGVVGTEVMGDFDGAEVG